MVINILASMDQQPVIRGSWAISPAWNLDHDYPSTNSSIGYSGIVWTSRLVILVLIRYFTVSEYSYFFLVCAQMDHALPDSLRNDFGLTRLGSTHTFSARKEEPHLVHPPATASEMVTGAVNLDQSHLCCYCFTRRAEHLVMDCREFESPSSEIPSWWNS